MSGRPLCKYASPKLFSAMKLAGEKFRAVRQPARMLRNPPHGKNENPEKRRVGVTVGHGLAADLNQSDDRYEAAEKPKPTGKEITIAAMAYAEIRKAQNDGKSQERFPECKTILGMRIKNDQTNGPQGFQYV